MNEFCYEVGTKAVMRKETRKALRVPVAEKETKAIFEIIKIFNFFDETLRI